jgi:DNA-binding PadR family transcriptional regulator
MPRPLFARSGLPLTSLSFYVLLSLSSDDRDPAAILEDVTMSSAGRVRLTQTRLKVSLRRLVGSGFVTAQDGDRYRLTHEGRLQLADELERMERAVRLARRRRVTQD